LARLGWSKGDNEVFNLEDLIRDFKINDVQKAGAVFDLTKLDWVNTQHLSKLDPTTFKKTLIPFIDKLKFDYSQYDQMDELIEAMRSVKPNLSLIAEALKPYLDNFNNYDEKGVKKFLIGSEEVLNRVKMLIESLNNWNEAEISKGLEAIQAELDLSTPKMNQPVRIALTGSTQSPSLSLTIKLIGRSKSIKLLDNALTYLSKN